MTIPLMKAFALEKKTENRLIDNLKSTFHVGLEQNAVGSLAGTIINTMPSIANYFVLGAGAILVIRGEWTLGSLLAFQSYLGYVFGPARFLASTNIQFQHSRAALERVSALFRLVPEKNDEKGLAVTALRGDIEFRHVTFGYSPDETVLKDLNFKISAGEKVAIVGESGVGKTTLIHLIMRFFQPSGGEILFDSRPAAEYELSSIRSRIGLVSQQTILLSGSIRENLCYGNPSASNDEIEKAIDVSGLRNLVDNLPDGLETILSELGKNLSEGQKQRISLARTLIKNPDIFILDEPTSALDRNTESTILTSLPTVVRNKTVIIIAHNTEAVSIADRVIVLRNGRIVGDGTHADLMRGNDHYRFLFGSEPERK